MQILGKYQTTRTQLLFRLIPTIQGLPSSSKEGEGAGGADTEATEGAATRAVAAQAAAEVSGTEPE